MHRTVIFSFLSAIVGGVVATMLISPHATTPESPAAAQNGTVAAAPPQVASRWTPPPVRPATLTPEEQIASTVYAQGNRSVVNVQTKSIEAGPFFFSEGVSQGAGSGVVLDREGHILTNYHVVEDAREVRVSLFDGSTYVATAIGADPSTDTAVLKIDAPADALFPAPFGDSSGLVVGQRVYAIGNPFALERTMTTGIISSLNRSLPSRKAYRTIKQVIQVDAAINPGNSGGPLFDTRGQMIGLNTAIASRTGQNTGVGFAIPVNTLSRVVPELIANGRVERADIGIAQVYETEQGLLIAAVETDGAAERAGLQGPRIVRERRQEGMVAWTQVYVDRSAADLIVGVDGQPVASAEDFITEVESRRPGATITVNVIRQGKPADVRVVLDAE